jgi:hypothetical protein
VVETAHESDEDYGEEGLSTPFILKPTTCPTCGTSGVIYSPVRCRTCNEAVHERCQWFGICLRCRPRRTKPKKEKEAPDDREKEATKVDAQGKAHSQRTDRSSTETNPKRADEEAPVTRDIKDQMLKVPKKLPRLESLRHLKRRDINDKVY